ncbi:MAG: GerMN domain-containing protein [bacterium]
MVSAKKRKSRKSLVVYILVVIGVFVVGVLVGPYLREKGYQIKDWVIQPRPPREMKVVKLYFSDPQAEYLILEERKVVALPDMSEEAREILKELIKGPLNSSLKPTVPLETEVRNVYVEGDCFYVDFSLALREKHPGGSSGELITTYSIVNTLLINFPSQSRVQILIQGKPAETLAGHIDIRNPLGKRLDIIKQP